MAFANGGRKKSPRSGSSSPSSMWSLKKPRRKSLLRTSKTSMDSPHSRREGPSFLPKKGKSFTKRPRSGSAKSSKKDTVLEEFNAVVDQVKKLRRRLAKILDGRTKNDVASQCETLRMRSVLLEKRLPFLGLMLANETHGTESARKEKILSSIHHWLKKFRMKLQLLGDIQSSPSRVDVSLPQLPNLLESFSPREQNLKNPHDKRESDLKYPVATKPILRVLIVRAVGLQGEGEYEVKMETALFTASTPAVGRAKRHIWDYWIQGEADERDTRAIFSIEYKGKEAKRTAGVVAFDFAHLFKHRKGRPKSTTTSDSSSKAKNDRPSRSKQYRRRRNQRVDHVAVGRLISLYEQMSHEATAKTEEGLDKMVDAASSIVSSSSSSLQHEEDQVIRGENQQGDQEEENTEYFWLSAGTRSPVFLQIGLQIQHNRDRHSHKKKSMAVPRPWRSMSSSLPSLTSLGYASSITQTPFRCFPFPVLRDFQPVLFNVSLTSASCNELARVFFSYGGVEGGIRDMHGAAPPKAGKKAKKGNKKKRQPVHTYSYSSKAQSAFPSASSSSSVAHAAGSYSSLGSLQSMQSAQSDPHPSLQSKERRFPGSPHDRCGQYYHDVEGGGEQILFAPANIRGLLARWVHETSASSSSSLSPTSTASRPQSAEGNHSSDKAMHTCSVELRLPKVATPDGAYLFIEAATEGPTHSISATSSSSPAPCLPTHCVVASEGKHLLASFPLRWRRAPADNDRDNDGLDEHGENPKQFVSNEHRRRRYRRQPGRRSQRQDTGEQRRRLYCLEKVPGPLPETLGVSLIVVGNGKQHNQMRIRGRAPRKPHSFSAADTREGVRVRIKRLGLVQLVSVAETTTSATSSTPSFTKASIKAEADKPAATADMETALSASPSVRKFLDQPSNHISISPLKISKEHMATTTNQDPGFPSSASSPAVFPLDVDDAGGGAKRRGRQIPATKSVLKQRHGDLSPTSSGSRRRKSSATIQSNGFRFTDDPSTPATKTFSSDPSTQQSSTATIDTIFTGSIQLRDDVKYKLEESDQTKDESTISNTLKRLSRELSEMAEEQSPRTPTSTQESHASEMRVKSLEQNPLDSMPTIGAIEANYDTEEFYPSSVGVASPRSLASRTGVFSSFLPGSAAALPSSIDATSSTGLRNSRAKTRPGSTHHMLPVPELGAGSAEEKAPALGAEQKISKDADARVENNHPRLVPTSLVSNAGDGGSSEKTRQGSSSRSPDSKWDDGSCSHSEGDRGSAANEKKTTIKMHESGVQNLDNVVTVDANDIKVLKSTKLRNRRRESNYSDVAVAYNSSSEHSITPAGEGGEQKHGDSVTTNANSIKTVTLPSFERKNPHGRRTSAPGTKTALGGRESKHAKAERLGIEGKRAEAAATDGNALNTTEVGRGQERKLGGDTTVNEIQRIKLRINLHKSTPKLGALLCEDLARALGIEKWRIRISDFASASANKEGLIRLSSTGRSGISTRQAGARGSLLAAGFHTLGLLNDACKSGCYPHKARRPGEERWVCVRVYRRNVLHQVLEHRLQRECELHLGKHGGARLQPHLLILKLISRVDLKGCIFMTSPLMHIKTLQHRILAADGKPMGEAFAICIAIQLSMALDHVHKHGVAHGEIAARHVLFTGAENFSFIKLTGFGTSGKGVDKSRNQGKNSDTGGGLSSLQMGDIHSMGVLLYQMLTGDLPTVQSPGSSSSNYISWGGEATVSEIGKDCVGNMMESKADFRSNARSILSSPWLHTSAEQIQKLIQMKASGDFEPSGLITTSTWTVVQKFLRSSVIERLKPELESELCVSIPKCIRTVIECRPFFVPIRVEDSKTVLGRKNKRQQRSAPSMSTGHHSSKQSSPVHVR